MTAPRRVPERGPRSCRQSRGCYGKRGISMLRNSRTTPSQNIVLVRLLRCCPPHDSPFLTDELDVGGSFLAFRLRSERLEKIEFVAQTPPGSQRFCLGSFRSRTPLSSKNSTPAASRAALSAASFAAVTGISPSIVSTRRIVATPTFEALAKSRALHLSRARAARSWALEIPMSLLVFLIQYCIFYISHTGAAK